MSRRRTVLLVVAGGAAVAGIGALAANQGERPRPEAVPATVVRAASGPAGVVMLRDGTVIRMDQQSPPGRLVVPPPDTGPQPDGLAVGGSRVWVSYDGLVRGYGQGGRTVRAFRISDGGPQLLAEGARVLWAGRRGSDILRSAVLTTRPVTRRATLLPVRMTGLTATARGAWVLGPAGAEGSVLLQVPPGGAPVRRVARLPGRPLGVSAALRTVWVLTSRGLHRVDHRTRRVRGPFPVPGGASEVAAGPGRVLITVPPSGVVVERTLTGRPTVHDVGRGVRGLAADREGFWVSVGARATPRRFSYSDGSG